MFVTNAVEALKAAEPAAAAAIEAEFKVLADAGAPATAGFASVAAAGGGAALDCHGVAIGFDGSGAISRLARGGLPSWANSSHRLGRFLYQVCSLPLPPPPAVHVPPRPILPHSYRCSPPKTSER